MEIIYRVNTKDIKGMKHRDYDIKTVGRGCWVFVSVEHRKGGWKNNEG